ncbi:metallophosphoesterase [Elongatibacter sediminis]|uniref:Metallophosphoesterase n=1 Tax=Elongatibacter sediminis TaxID=3119006 RepID=A0AAW9R783_9GAMM
MTLLVQLTDTHIVEPGHRLYNKADTAAHLADAVAQINAMSPQPDRVMITGDLVEHPGQETYDHFARLIEPLHAPVNLLPGNHDDPAILREQFDGTGCFPAEGPTYQYTIEDLPFRILALNSHYAGSELPAFGPRRLAWLEAALEESDRPTMIAIHHPPMITGVEFIDMVGVDWYADIARVIAANSQVRLVICGHGHTDLVGTIAHAPVYMAGSIAHQLVAARGNDHAPGFDNRPVAPVLHHWLGERFVSGSHPWPAWVDDHRIDTESGLAWTELKDRMRGSMR